MKGIAFHQLDLRAARFAEAGLPGDILYGSEFAGGAEAVPPDPMLANLKRRHQSAPWQGPRHR